MTGAQKCTVLMPTSLSHARLNQLCCCCCSAPAPLVLCHRLLPLLLPLRKRNACDWKNWGRWRWAPRRAWARALPPGAAWRRNGRMTVLEGTILQARRVELSAAYFESATEACDAEEEEDGE